MLVDRHKFWMDDSNWVDQSGDLKYKILKKTLLESIIRSKNISEFSLRILDDIDCLACLLNCHTIVSTQLIYKVRYCKFLRNKDHVLHLLTIGIFDSSIRNRLLKKFPAFKNDAKLAFNLLSENEDFFYFSYFNGLLRNEQFALSLFENKKFNNPYVLISLPEHKKITQLLIKRYGFFNKKKQECDLVFSKEVIEDVRFISRHIKSHAGDKIYDFLPKKIKESKTIALAMLKHHPELNVVRPELKTLENFKLCSKHWCFYNNLVDQINFFGDVFNDDEHLFEALKSIKHIKGSRLSDLNYRRHPIVSLIVSKSSTSKLCSDFLLTTNGQHLMSQPFKTHADILDLDKYINTEVFPIFEKIKLNHKLSKLKKLERGEVVKI